MTHVDADHIDGVLELLRDEELGTTCGDVWFNGWRHLPDTPLESLGPVEGELLTRSDPRGRDLAWNDGLRRRGGRRPNEGRCLRVDLGDDVDR